MTHNILANQLASPGVHDTGQKNHHPPYYEWDMMAFYCTKENNLSTDLYTA